jgi:2-iminobutanoate/2-iminopropanoate deaminase
MEVSLIHLTTPAAPAPLGTYSHGVRVGEVLFCSSQLPLDPASGQLCGAAAYEQARQCLENLDAVCRAASTTLAAAARITVYFLDRAVMPEVDRAFAERFGDRPPARVPVHVVSLARGAHVSMDAIVAVG